MAEPTRTTQAEDIAHMRSALALARRGLGNTWPNPSVGCVVVKDGRVVGRAVTAPGGRPHAESAALDIAGKAARGATVYVTLEPCCHWGRTPPCTDALISAGVARVVIATRDPDPRVDGAGIARLRAAGIAVEEGVLRDEADEVAAGFRDARPSGPPAGHAEARLDAGWPDRHAGGRKPLDHRPGRAPRGARAARAARCGDGRRRHGDGGRSGADLPPAWLPAEPGWCAWWPTAICALRSAPRWWRPRRETPTWMLIRNGADPERRDAFAELGVRLVEVAGAEAASIRHRPWGRSATPGLTRVLVEGGAQLAASLLRADLVDRIAWFHAPAVMGADAWPAVQAFGIEQLDAMPRFARTAQTLLGEDMLSEFTRRDE